MAELAKYLEAFESTSLSEMNAIKLLNRHDTKYVFHERKLSAILEDLVPYYSILEIDDARLMKYENQYYDTSDYECYNMHQRGRLNRTKVRIRTYVESDLSFIEVKTKTNKSRTIKERIPMQPGEDLKSPRIVEFVNSHSPIPVQDLSNEINIDFDRITLAHKNLEDRCTIDVNLRTHWYGKKHQFDNLVIAELKQNRFKHSSDFNLVLKKHKVYSASFSKYCFSFLSVNDDLKKNNFKPKLHQLHKILS